MVSNLNIRHPLSLAKDAITIDHISAGRMTLGLGAAGTGYDATLLGQSPLTPGQRVDRLREATALIDRLLRGENGEHHGDYYEVNGARALPNCVQRPRVPLAIAAGGGRSLRIAAEFGDAWITYGDTTKTDVSIAGTERIVASQRALLDQHLVSFRRDVEEMDRIYLIGNTEARPLSSLGAFQDFAGRYAELGFTDVVFHMPRPDDAVWDEHVEIVELIAQAMLA